MFGTRVHRPDGDETTRPSWSWTKEDFNLPGSFSNQLNNLGQQGEEACVSMWSDAVLVAVRGSGWVVGKAETEHRSLESCVEEVLVKVERSGKDRE